MNKYTVFFEQTNRTNFQVTANDKEEAVIKATRLYKKHMEIPLTYIQNGWVREPDGEDK